jgi:polyribonucleotide nucleotidyltransferase
MNLTMINTRGIQMSTSVDIEFDLNNLNEIYEIGKVAKQANGAVLLKEGKTVILATIASEFDNPVDEDFTPLTVQYVEKTYATGKFPGGFIKRESKPSDFETLTARVIDRSLRPLFPAGFRYPTQITVMVLSTDEEADLQVLALNAASAALYISDLPISQSVAAIRVGKVDNQIVINPSMSQLQDSTLDIFVAGSGTDLLMIEMKANSSIEIEMIDVVDPVAQTPIATNSLMKSNEMGEDELLDVLKLAGSAIKEATFAYADAFKEVAKPQVTLELVDESIKDDIYQSIKSNNLQAIKDAVTKMAKSERNSDLKSISRSINEAFDEWSYDDIYKAVEKIKKEIVREMIIKDGIRADGRATNEVRPISIETNILPSAHGSCLFTRGETQALVVATLGNDRDAQMYERVSSKTPFHDNFMVHYNFPGFSVGEAKPMFAPGRRELGHGNLAKRALEPTINLDAKETIRLVSEVLESNGSSSMATVCGGSLALSSANVPTSKLIAGIAMGLVLEGDKYAVLTDIMGLEDHDGDMDFKVAGSKDGITAMQMDIKLGGLDFDILKVALSQARMGRLHILEIMEDAQKAIVINQDALPALERFLIDPAKIAMVIGKAGSTIRGIIETFGVAIDLDRDGGVVKVSGESLTQVQKAVDHIKSITLKEDSRDRKPSINFAQVYKEEEILVGKVIRITDFGAFTELPKGGEGLLHISKLSNTRVNRVTDVVNEGDDVEVRVLKVSKDRIELAHVNYGK